METSGSILRRHTLRLSYLCFGAVLLLGGGTLLAQDTPGLSPLPSAEQVIQRSQDTFSGSIPQGKATPEVIDLTVEDALDRGLKYNLGLYLSDRATDQTRAARLRSLAELMPVVNGAFSEEGGAPQSESLRFRLSRAFPAPSDHSV